jgi:hypothetical protein
MALKPGTATQLEGSLAEEIERAFAAELYALKQKELSETGRQEMRMLFSAIAQAVLGYLAANPSALAVTVGSGTNKQTGTVQVNAPWISLDATFGTVGVDGGGFPANASIALTWEEPHGPAGSANAATDGTFSASITFDGRSGRQAISGVDGAGNRATGTVNIQ